MKIANETLLTMCRQESDGYETMDYLQQEEKEESLTNEHCPLHKVKILDINEDSRCKMVAWCHQVVDFCNFDRETVLISMNILDRFMMTPSGKQVKFDRKIYQLAAMTALYTAVKVHESEAMDPRLISSLSQGYYTCEQVDAMELKILTALTWRVNPPTSMAFVRQYVALLPKMDDCIVEAVYDLSRFQTEVAVLEYNCLTVKPSTLALCSLINALDNVGVEEKVIGQLQSQLDGAITMDERMAEIQEWLYQAILRKPAIHDMKAQYCPDQKQYLKSTSQRPSVNDVSPRSVHV